MKPTIKTIHKRIENARCIFTTARFVLLNHPIDPRAVCLIDLSSPHTGNLFTSYMIEIFCKGYMGHCDFETIYIGGGTANYYGVLPDHYLSITYHL